MPAGSEDDDTKPLPPPARRRSKRLRKKLRVDEYKEYGFAVGFRISESLSAKEKDELWDAFNSELIARRGLAFGGSEEGYVTKFGRGSATEEDRAAVAAWLKQRPGVDHVVLGPLEDSWYGQARNAG